MRYADIKLREEEIRAQKYLETSSSVNSVWYNFYFFLNILQKLFFFLVNRKLCESIGSKLSAYYFSRMYRYD